MEKYGQYRDKGMDGLERTLAFGDLSVNSSPQALALRPFSPSRPHQAARYWRPTMLYVAPNLPFPEFRGSLTPSAVPLLPPTALLCLRLGCMVAPRPVDAGG
jgi:hypothetical protein